MGTYVFPYIEAAGGSNTTASAQYPFYVSSSLCFVSAALAFFLLPSVGQDSIELEDLRFREFLESQGWDTRQLGLKAGESTESITEKNMTPLSSEGAAATNVKV